MFAKTSGALDGSERSEPARTDGPAKGRAYWVRTIAYWAFTLLVAYEMAAGALWDLLRIEYVRVILTHLGYPMYLLTILGVWKAPCAAVILIPRFERVKEWAYAGAFFNYSGAFASHYLVRDGADRFMPPLIFAAFTLASRALCPPDRRVIRNRAPLDARPLVWAVPVAIFVGLLVVAYATLPQGPPPGY